MPFRQEKSFENQENIEKTQALLSESSAQKSVLQTIKSFFFIKTYIM